MLELEAAVERILGTLLPAVAESVAIGEAHRRVLFADLSSPADLPAFDNSAVDGYAVRAVDTNGASEESPVTLRQRGRVAAGETFAEEVAAGDCVRIFTGSPMPRGADAVVMQEDTRVEGDNVSICAAAKPWENVRFRGEDVKKGAAIAHAGEVLATTRLQLLAATGVARIETGRRPTVALLATGSELMEPGGVLMPGKIHESNRLALATLATQAGAIPNIFPLVEDTLAATRAALETAFRECDLVITSGGVSVGEMDFVKQAFGELGGKLEFWKVAIRPGRPFVFGQFGKKFLFGLPGNPVSAFVTFLLLVRPAILRWQGTREVSLPAHPATLAEPLSNPRERRHFMRVTVDTAGTARSAGAQASHVLSSLAAANGLVDVPPKTNLAAGSTVRVLRWEL